TPRRAGLYRWWNAKRADRAIRLRPLGAPSLLLDLNRVLSDDCSPATSGVIRVHKPDGEVAYVWVAPDIARFHFELVGAVGVAAGVEPAREPEAEEPWHVRVVLCGVGRVDSAEVDVGCGVALDIGVKRGAVVEGDLPWDDRLRSACEPPADACG